MIDESVIEVDYLSSDGQKTGFYIRKSRNWSVATLNENGFSYALVTGDYVFSNEKLEYIIGNIK